MFRREDPTPTLCGSGRSCKSPSATGSRHHLPVSSSGHAGVCCRAFDRTSTNEEEDQWLICIRSVASRFSCLAITAGPFVTTASAQSAKAVQNAILSLAPGGKTLVGPGLYTRQPNVADFAVQLTEDTDVCGTVTLIDGDSVQLNLRDAANANLQGVVANSTLRTAAGCAGLTRNVELMCTGAVPCTAAWRVDAR